MPLFSAVSKIPLGDGFLDQFQGWNMVLLSDIWRQNGWQQSNETLRHTCPEILPVFAMQTVG